MQLQLKELLSMARCPYAARSQLRLNSKIRLEDHGHPLNCQEAPHMDHPLSIKGRGRQHLLHNSHSPTLKEDRRPQYHNPEEAQAQGSHP